MVESLPRPKIFAHRGASKHAPENTIAAFELAIQHEADGIELDAKLTIDGQIVVIHDQTVDRTTGTSGSVAEMSLAQLKELEAGSFFDDNYRGEKIPTLEEVFEAVGKKTYINVELTNYASKWDDLPDKAVSLVRKFSLENNVLFSSFNPIALRRTAKLLPQTARGLLTLPGGSGWLLRGWLGRLLVPYQALHPEYRDVTSRMVADAHHHHKRVNVWTVNEANQMKELIKLKVDGIITDDPRLARELVNAMD